jgi:hypothetical protein
MRTRARISNRGWRIDYFLVNDINKCVSSDILTEIVASDHCPIYLEINYLIYKNSVAYLRVLALNRNSPIHS